MTITITIEEQKSILQKQWILSWDDIGFTREEVDLTDPERPNGLVRPNFKRADNAKCLMYVKYVVDDAIKHGSEGADIDLALERLKDCFNTYESVLDEYGGI